MLRALRTKKRSGTTQPAPQHDDADAAPAPGVDVRGTIQVIGAVPGLFGLILFQCFNNFLGGVFMALMDAYGLLLVSVQVWGTLFGILSLGFIVGGTLLGGLSLLNGLLLLEDLLLLLQDLLLLRNLLLFCRLLLLLLRGLLLLIALTV